MDLYYLLYSKPYGISELQLTIKLKIIIALRIVVDDDIDEPPVIVFVDVDIVEVVSLNDRFKLIIVRVFVNVINAYPVAGENSVILSFLCACI